MQVPALLTQAPLLLLSTHLSIVHLGPGQVPAGTQHQVAKVGQVLEVKERTLQPVSGFSLGSH